MTSTSRNITCLLSDAKRRAAKAGIPFSITREDVKIPTHCPVLGIKLVTGRGKRTDASPSLDRIVPQLGYTPGNVIVVSWRANFIKTDATPDELLRVAKFYTRKAKETR